MQKESIHFHVFYGEENGDFADKLLSRIEEFYLDMCGKAGVSPEDGKYDLYVCGTTEEFIHYTGKTKENYQDWMVGNTDISRKRLCILSPRAKGDLSEEYESYLIQVMLHEVAHIVFDRLCKPEDCAIWVAEGVAIYYAGQVDMTYVSEEEYVPVSVLADAEDEIAFAENGGYDYAGVYVGYLIETCGLERFRLFYRGECGLEELSDSGFEQRAIAACSGKEIKTMLHYLQDSTAANATEENSKSS